MADKKDMSTETRRDFLKQMLGFGTGAVLASTVPGVLQAKADYGINQQTKPTPIGDPPATILNGECPVKTDNNKNPDKQAKAEAVITPGVTYTLPEAAANTLVAASNSQLTSFPENGVRMIVKNSSDLTRAVDIINLIPADDSTSLQAGIKSFWQDGYNNVFTLNIDFYRNGKDGIDTLLSLNTIQDLNITVDGKDRVIRKGTAIAPNNLSLQPIVTPDSGTGVVTQMRWLRVGDIRSGVEKWGESHNTNIKFPGDDQYVLAEVQMDGEKVTGMVQLATNNGSSEIFNTNPQNLTQAQNNSASVAVPEGTATPIQLVDYKIPQQPEKPVDLSDPNNVQVILDQEAIDAKIQEEKKAHIDTTVLDDVKSAGNITVNLQSDNKKSEYATTRTLPKPEIYGNFSYFVSYTPDGISIDFTFDTKLSKYPDLVKAFISRIILIASKQKAEKKLSSGSFANTSISNDFDSYYYDKIIDDKNINKLSIVNLKAKK